MYPADSSHHMATMEAATPAKTPSQRFEMRGTWSYMTLTFSFNQVWYVLD